MTPNHKLLFVHDKGQMCNNIIQYGHVYAWAREHQWHTLSMRFAYKYRYFRISHTVGHHILTYALAKSLAKLRLLPTVVCENYAATEQETDEALRRYPVAVVTGWNIRFYDLFEKYLDDIRRLFTFDASIEHHVATLLQPSRQDGNNLLLGVHIRRGDYDKLLNGSYFYADDVYIQAIRQFQTLHPSRPITVVICGNVRINRRSFRTALPEMDFIFPNGNPGEDLCALSHCDYLMGPPSSYSLVASMYHAAPLHFITSRDETFTPDDFHPFAYLLRHFDSYFYGH